MNLSHLLTTCALLGVLTSCGPSTDSSAGTSQLAAPEAPLALPAGFPSDIPSFPDAAITYVWERAPNGKKTYNVTMEIDAAKFSPQQARDFYRTELEKRGWPKGEARDNANAGNYSYLSTRRPTEVSLMIYLKADDQTKTSINLLIMDYVPAP